MPIEIVEERVVDLAAYARVSIAFEVRRVLDVQPSNAAGRFSFAERPLSTPIRKDYDAIPGSHPTDWAASFDLTHWGFLAALVDGQRVGGAAVVFPSAGVEMLEGRDDLAVLWDIRVAPAVRGQGVGSALLRAVEQWTLRRGSRWLEAETQDINVPACRFYARHGFVLEAVNPSAYPDLPKETRLLWYKRL
jgi:GNAT superfamily N-acetyltransferase